MKVSQSVSQSLAVVCKFEAEVQAINNFKMEFRSWPISYLHTCVCTDLCSSFALMRVFPFHRVLLAFLVDVVFLVLPATM